MDRMLRWAGPLALVAAGSAPGHAQPAIAQITVVRTELEPGCADTTAIATAIARHTQLPAQVVDRRASAPGGLEVRVYGEEEYFKVKLGGASGAIRIFEGAPCATIPDVVAAFVATVVTPAPELPPPPVEPPSDDDAVAGKIRSERALVLYQSSDMYTLGRKTFGRWFVAGTAAVAGGLGLSLGRDSDRASQGFILASAATAVATSAISIAAPRSGRADTAADAGACIGLGLLHLGMSAEHPDATPFLTLGASFITSGAWMLVDAVVDPEVSVATIVDMRARIRTPRQRAALSEAELADMERTFRRADWRKRYLIPPMIASAIISARAAVERDPDRRAFGLTVGLYGTVVYGLIMLIPGPVARYHKRLREAGLDVHVTGTGVIVGGRF